MREPSAAQMAMSLLQNASQRLGTASPARMQTISRVLDDSMPYPVGDPAYRNSRMLETNFNETAGDTLAFDMDPGGPRSSPWDRVELATRAMSDIVSQHLGRDARDWLDRHANPQRSSSGRSGSSWGASLGTSLDRDGIRESHITYEWGPDLMDALPAPLYRMAKIALTTLPGLRPVLSTLRCGRMSGTQQVTFELERATSLASLQPLMDALGLSAQHSSLMSTAAFLMGARFVLPPDTATITLRPVRTGVEMRLDVNLDALPDPPERLLPLLRMQMTERPSSSRALDKWLMALTPDGFPGPGTVSILSVWVKPNMPARVALYLRPFVLEGDHARQQRPPSDMVQQPDPAAASAWG